MEEAEVLFLVAGVEAGCEHPLAWAVVDAAKEKNMAIPKAEDIQVDKGLGVIAQIGQRRVSVGSCRYLEGLGVSVPENVEEDLSLGGSQVKKRLVRYLLDLSIAQESPKVTLSLSGKELAQFLGTTPETLSRRWTQLEKEGLIEKKGKQVQLLDLEKLEKV